METKIFNVDQLEEAAKLITTGELVAFPTETVYGLGADALNSQAALSMFKAKGRPADNPLIVHVKEASEVEKIAYTNAEFHLLAERFWPGPLTMILPKKPIVPYETTGGLETVAVRCPNHKIALRLIELAKTPIAAPSANRSGRPSPTEAKHVYEDLKGIIAGIVDGGHTGIGLESTVLDLTGETPEILRPGGVTLEMLKVYLPQARQAVVKAGQKVKSPGLKYRHYAPKAPMYMVIGTPEEQIKEILLQLEKNGPNVGVLATDESYHLYPTPYKISLGSRHDLAMIATNLYGALRYFDSTNVKIIFAETISGEGLATAINDRLTRACGGQRILAGH